MGKTAKTLSIQMSEPVSCRVDRLKQPDEEPETAENLHRFGLWETNRWYSDLQTTVTETGPPKRKQMALKGSGITWID